jgi:hypothetical protein
VSSVEEPRSLRSSSAPLFDLAPKICHQLFQRRKGLGRFLVTDVLVIALAVSLSKRSTPHLINHKGRAIFELVPAVRNRAWQLPDHNISELTLA